MKKKFIFIVPALFGIFLSACNSTSSESSISSSENSSSDTSISSESSSSSTSSTTSIIEQYEVTFKDENGQTLESKKWNKGTIPSYIYNKEDTPEYHFTFKGWSTSLNGPVIDIPEVSGDATYYAVISKTKRSYNIKFCNENGTLIKSDSLEYGSKPTCDYVGPNDNQEFDYTFKGWSTSLNGSVIDIPEVSGDATYYAIVSKTKQLYVVNFYDENGALIKSDSLEYGSKPSCDYVGPSDNQEFDYTFKGWTNTKGGSNLVSFENVKENASYYAVVDAVKKVYTISFVPNGGSAVSSIAEEYGTSINEPEKPTRDGYKFVGWSINGPQGEKVTWPYVIKDNVTFYANWNEKVDIKTYFQAMMSALNQDPYSYIPLTMQPTNSANHVSKDDVNYDFSNFTNVSNIKYGGHGEQWHMVLDNINESQRFYSILTICETAINSSVVAFNNYLDKNPSDTASHTLKETTYTASLDFKENVLSYTLQYNTNISNKFFGDIVPQIDMTYDIKTLEKAVRIQLTDTNAMKYVVKDNSYTFALKYGVSAASRNAYFEINRNDDGEVNGHIYEYVQLKDKDMVPACADFYIGETYSSVVGNKASGLVGFKGYINELYETSKGKLIGYEVRETLTVLGVSGQYNTLWFNLNDINGINSVKAVENENNTGNYTNKNPYDIYLNGNSSIFEPTYNKKLTINTSKKYDVELRRQYFYGYENGEFKTYETLVPMMFIQADNDVDSNFSDFSKDIASKSKINASVKLEQKYLDKIEEDYSSLIDIFVKNKDSITSEKIKDYIGDAKNIK